MQKMKKRQEKGLDVKGRGKKKRYNVLLAFFMPVLSFLSPALLQIHTMYQDAPFGYAVLSAHKGRGKGDLS